MFPSAVGGEAVPYREEPRFLMKKEKRRKLGEEAARLFEASVREGAFHRALAYVGAVEEHWDVGQSWFLSQFIGHTYHQTGFLTRALVHCERATQVADAEKRQRSAWAELGRLKKEIGDFEGAVSAFKLAMEEPPRSSEIHILTANCLKALGRLEEGEQLLYYALDVVQGDPEEVYVNLAYFQVLRGNEAGARASLAKALEIDPGYDVALALRKEMDINLGPGADWVAKFKRCVQQDGYIRALTLADALERDARVREDWFLSQYLGMAYREGGVFRRAQPHLERAPGLADSDERRRLAFMQVANGRRDGGDLEGAVTAYHQALEYARHRFTWPWILVGDCYKALDQTDKAREMFHEALACEEGNFDEAWLNLAFFPLLAGDLDEARECLRRALELVPDFESAQLFLAQLEMELEAR